MHIIFDPSLPADVERVRVLLGPAPVAPSAAVAASTSTAPRGPAAA